LKKYHFIKALGLGRHFFTNGTRQHSITFKSEKALVGSADNISFVMMIIRGFLITDDI